MSALVSMTERVATQGVDDQLCGASLSKSTVFENKSARSSL